jgi:hypothetical protein
MRIFVVFALLLLTLQSYAVRSTRDEAGRVRQMLEKKSNFNRARVEPSQTIMLAVSPGITQGSTSLCWSFSTLNLLETKHLIATTKLAQFSRSAMQYIRWEDRFLRYIIEGVDYLAEGGTAIDAISFIRNKGLFDLADLPAITEGKSISKDSFTGSREENVEKLYTELAATYSVPPAKTHYQESEVTPAELTETVLGKTEWQSYAISDKLTGWDKHPDADANPGTKSFYIARTEMPDLIKRALEAGNAVEISVEYHSILIYGADLDENGVATAYYIKDSYPDYFYKADVASAHRRIWELTTAL